MARVLWFLGVFLSLLSGPALAQTPVAQTEIEWRVENRFRLFDAPEPEGLISVAPAELNPADQFLEDLANSPDEAERYSAITSFLGSTHDWLGDDDCRMPYLATAYLGAGPVQGERPSPDRRYRDGYAFPDHYIVRASVPEFRDSDLDCYWQVGELQDEARPRRCSDDVYIRIEAQEPGSGDYRAGAVPTVVKVVVGQGRERIAEDDVTVEFPDRLVVSLGESYASGEGNPDRPQSYRNGLNENLVEACSEPGQLSSPPELEGALQANELTPFQEAVDRFWQRSPDPYERWWRSREVLALVETAQWWDPLCHRSLYNQHAVAAYLYSAHHPQEAVTFAAFSCSGASTHSGLLAPQFSPPGRQDFGLPSGWRKEPEQIVAQLEDALSFTCDNQLLNSLDDVELRLAPTETQGRRRSDLSVRGSTTRIEQDCEDNLVPRKVDTVLISLGGNDVGFSGAVKNALLPEMATDIIGQTVLNFARDRLGTTPPYIARRRIAYDLPELYRQTRQNLRAALAPAGTPVIQSPYPDELYSEVPSPNPFISKQSFCEGPHDNLLFGAVHGIFPDDNNPANQRWRLDFTRVESVEAQEALLGPLNKQVSLHIQIANRESGGTSDWRMASYGSAFDQHGWCAGNPEEANAFGFPIWQRLEPGPAPLDIRSSNGISADNRLSQSTWTSFDPETWDPYAARQRYFRTGNDVVLTQIGSTNGIGLGIANSAYYSLAGMFHPTAQGHAVMGTSVSCELEVALNLPGQGNKLPYCSTTDRTSVRQAPNKP